MRLVDAVLTLVDPLRRARRLYAAAEAVVCDDVRLSYAELGQRVDAVAAALRSGGLEPGDRVALLAANCHRYLELLLAVPGAGIVPVPPNTRLSPAEMRHVLTRHPGAGHRPGRRLAGEPGRARRDHPRRLRSVGRCGSAAGRPGPRPAQRERPGGAEFLTEVKRSCVGSQPRGCTAQPGRGGAASALGALGPAGPGQHASGSRLPRGP